MSPDIFVAITSAISSLIAAGVALYIAVRKTPTEITKNKAEAHRTEAESHKAEAEADLLHAQVADRWAEHVKELQEQVRALTLDVAQVRRENETYRGELKERDQIIADLKDWAERLITQLATHAPHVQPEEYRRKPIGEDTLRRLRKKAQGDT
jgi:cell division protein FtsB